MDETMVRSKEIVVCSEESNSKYESGGNEMMKMQEKV